MPNRLLTNVNRLLTTKIMEYIIAQKENIEDIAAIETACFSIPWNSLTLAAELENDCSHIFAAVDDGRAVGYVLLYIVAGEADIVRVAVLPEYRRQGIARALLNCAFDKVEGAVFLDVRESNTPAIELYKSLGFADTGVRKNYYSNPTENAVLMKRE